MGAAGPPAGGYGARPRAALGVAASGRLSSHTSVRALTGINAAAATGPSSAREGGRAQGGGAVLAMAPPPQDGGGAITQQIWPEHVTGAVAAAFPTADSAREGPRSGAPRGQSRGGNGEGREPPQPPPLCRAPRARRRESRIRSEESARAALSLRERWRRCGMSRRCGPGRGERGRAGDRG